MNPASPGHSLWCNFLCDLASEAGVNGRPNPGASWGRAAEWLLVAALCLFWWTLSPLLEERRALRPIIATLGTVGTVGLVLVPVTGGVAHAMALVAGAIPGFAATTLALHGLRHRPGLFVLGAVALVLAALELCLYLAFLHGPMPVSVPAIQRLALLTGVAWMASTAVVVFRGQELVAVRGSSTGSPRAT